MSAHPHRATTSAEPFPPGLVPIEVGQDQSLNVTRKGDVMLIAAFIVVAVVAILEFFVYRFWKQRNACRAELEHCQTELQRYSGIADVKAAVDATKNELEQAKQKAGQTVEEDKQRREQLKGQYKQALARYEELQHQVSLLE